MALLQTQSDCLFATSSYSAYDVLESLHYEEQEVFALLDEAKGTQELHDRLHALLRAWEASTESIQKDKEELEVEVAKLKKASDDAKHQELRARHSLAEKTAEWAEVEKAFLDEIEALHMQEEKLTADLEAKDKLYQQEAVRSNKALAQYHTRLLEVDQEIDEILHLHRQRHCQPKAFGDILPGLFDEVPLSSRSSEKWEVRDESEESSYSVPEGLSETQAEVFKRLADLHAKVHKFRHCDLSQDLPESEHSLNQAFVESLPSDLKSLSVSRGTEGALKGLSMRDMDQIGYVASPSVATEGGLESLGYPVSNARDPIEAFDFTAFSRDVNLEDILGATEEVKDFQDESSIEKLSDHNSSKSSCGLISDLEMSANVALNASRLLDQSSQSDQKPFNCSGLSEIPLSFDSEHTNTAEGQTAVNSEQVTNRRGVPKLPLNLITKSKPSASQVFQFDISSDRAPPFRSPRREPTYKLNISISLNNESFTLVSEGSSVYIEDRSRERIKLKQQPQRDAALFPPLNLSIESKGSSHKQSKAFLSPISIPNKVPTRPITAPRQGLKNSRGRSLHPTSTNLSPVSIPTSPYHLGIPRRSMPDDSSQRRSSSPPLFNRFRMRRYCEPKEPRLCILSHH